MHVRLVGQQGQADQTDQTDQTDQAVLVVPSHQKNKAGKKRRTAVLLAKSNAFLEMVMLVVAGVPKINYRISICNN